MEFILHIHFCASMKQYLSLRPNNLLWDEIIKYGIEKGYYHIHVGGGNTELENDSLLRFKRNFSKTTRDFYIGKKTHNEKVYNEVIRQWEVKYPYNKEKSKKVLLRYRIL